MKRLLLYVHFNKYNNFSQHVFYQLEQMRPLFDRIVFVSNSLFSDVDKVALEKAGLIDDFIQRKNQGYDFAAWHDGMKAVGFEMLADYDSITCMNDTCFGPLWDMSTYYERYEGDDSVDFWGMTNHRAIDAGHVYIDEHLQSYFMSFKKRLVKSSVFQSFWQQVESYTNVQDVIDHYETKYTKLFVEAGFTYQSVLDTTPIANQFYHSNFTIHYPQVLLEHKVPFIKIKMFDLTQHLAPYVIKEIKTVSPYPVELILEHMTDVTLPTSAYLLEHKLLKASTIPYSNTKTVAIHLHVYYVDLLLSFLTQFKHYDFAYDLFITTDTDAKKSEIETILSRENCTAKVVVTGNRGRDLLPLFLLEKELSSYDYIGHFHTKKSPEYPHWVGDSWRNELIDMLIKSASLILSQLEQEDKLGLVIADIPSFFRYTKIVDPWNELKFAADMNDLWQRMNVSRPIDFEEFSTYIMSYGSFIWFKYDALKPMFELEWSDEDIPAEPLPQHTILHSIERIFVYLAWARGFDYKISPNHYYMTPFVDNTVVNIRSDREPNTYINFDQIGGIKGALKYIIVGPGTAVKYILRRLLKRVRKG